MLEYIHNDWQEIVRKVANYARAIELPTNFFATTKSNRVVVKKSKKLLGLSQNIKKQFNLNWYFHELDYLRKFSLYLFNEKKGKIIRVGMATSILNRYSKNIIVIEEKQLNERERVRV